MAKVLPSHMRAPTERPQGQEAPIWLLEVVLDQGTEVLPPVLLRICDGTEELQWPLSDPGLTRWYPMGFAFTPVEQTDAGSLTQVDLTIDNTSRMLMPWLHQANGLEGNKAKLYLVYKNGLSIAYPAHEFELSEWEIEQCSAADDAVSLRLAMPNWFEIASPTDRYIPKKCRHEFGSDDCGYVINEFSAFQRCPKLITACSARALDMAARGLPPVLPGNFRGYPGISNQR